MPRKRDIQKRFKYLEKAFDKDGFEVKNFLQDETYRNLEYVTTQGFMVYQDKIGCLGLHKTAKNGRTGESKKVYYVEGNSKQMGFLLGLMAEQEVSRMTTEFVENVVLDFFDLERITKSSSLINYIKKILIDLLGQACLKEMRADIPQIYIDEINALYRGCHEANRSSKVELMDLWALNFGIDYLLTHVYTGKIFKQKKVPPSLLKLPITCNAFSLFGKYVKRKHNKRAHYFGRDFMFPTAGVYQDVACLIIHNPEGRSDQRVLPFVSQTAPGIVGCAAGMNINGVAIGVDISPSRLCNPYKPGFNSLTVNRDCMQHCPDIESVIERIIDTPRGVSWIYAVSDGQTDEACIIEAGCDTGNEAFPYYTDIPRSYKKHLPNEEYIEQKRILYQTPPPQRGVMVRRHDYKYPSDYIEDYNEELWDHYNTHIGPKLFRFVKNFLRGLMIIFTRPKLVKIFPTIWKEIMNSFKNVEYDPDYFKEEGYISESANDIKCPGSFYFAPQREPFEHGVLATNHFITPEMRLTAMAEWTSAIAAYLVDDFQWRYDELNNQILSILDEAKNSRKPIDEQRAQHLIDFLRPTDDNPKSVCREYYNPGFKKDGKTIPIQGSISLFELKGKTIRTHIGYYGDEWIEITLPYYIH
jgi:hypothetical protein